MISKRAAIAAASALVMPSLAYVLLDHGVWSWDPASYGELSLVLYLDLAHHPSQWAHDLFHSTGLPHAPGIQWLGQWFVALRGLTGSVEHALLLLPLLTQAAILALVWASVWMLSGGALLPTLAACLFVGAAPLYVGLSTKLLVEPLQALSVAGFLHTAVASRRWSRRDTLSAILFWGSFTVLTKVTSPLYCLVPAAVSAWDLVRLRDRPPPSPASWARLALALLLLVLAADWYRTNLRPLLEFARMASAGSVAELYGHRAPFFAKLVTWLRLANASFSRWNLWVLVILGAAASAAARHLRVFASARPADRLFPAAMMALAQVALVLTVLCLNVSEDPRFVYAIVPCLGVIVGWLVARVEPRPAAATLAGLLLVQFGAMHAMALGLTKGEATWLVPLSTDRHREEVMAALVAATADAASNGKVVFIAVELPWLNHANYALEARKQSEKTGFMPLPEGFGFDLHDADRGFVAIENEHPARVISYADPGEQQLKSVFNRSALSLLEKFRGSPNWVERGFASDPGIRIFLPRGGVSHAP